MVPLEQICVEILVFLVKATLLVLVPNVRFSDVDLKFSWSYKVHKGFIFGNFSSVFRVGAWGEIRIVITRILLLDVDHVWRGKNAFQFDYKHRDGLIPQLFFGVFGPIQSQLLCDAIWNQLIEHGVVRYERDKYLTSDLSFEIWTDLLHEVFEFLLQLGSCVRLMDILENPVFEVPPQI